MRTYILSALLFILIALMSFTLPRFTLDTHYVDSEQRGLDEQVTIHFSHVVAENTPKGRAALYFKKLVEQKSDGQIQVELYPNAMLYNDTTELAALKRNDVQMIAPTYSKVSSELPIWSVLDLPFLFRDEADVARVFNSDVGQELLDAAENRHIHGLGFWQNGFKQMIAKDAPIRTIAQFKDKRMRTMDSTMLKRQAQLLGADAQPASFDEVNLLLDHQTIDIQENTLSNIYSKSFYKQEPYITLSNHGILGYGVLMNETFWQSLSPAHQHIIEEAMKETTIYNDRLAKKMNEADYEKMNDYGTVFYELPDAEKQKWQQKLKPLYDNFRVSEYQNILEHIEKVLKET
jgi:C4-dicarboxylate-binding protein DctP